MITTARERSPRLLVGAEAGGEDGEAGGRRQPHDESGDSAGRHEPPGHVVGIRPEGEQHGERQKKGDHQQRPLRRPPDPCREPLRAGGIPDPSLHLRPEDEKTHDEQRGGHEAGDDREGEHALPEKAALVDVVVRRRQSLHQRRCGRRRRPEREEGAEDRQQDPGARRRARSLEAVAQERGRLLRDHGLGPIDEVGDQLRVRHEREDPEDDEETRRDREEEGVGDRLGRGRDAVGARLHRCPTQDEPGVGEHPHGPVLPPASEMKPCRSRGVSCGRREGRLRACRGRSGPERSRSAS